MPYENIDKKNYFTISPCGVTHYSKEMVFTKLPSWEQEYTIFVKLTDVSKWMHIYFLIRLVKNEATLNKIIFRSNSSKCTGTGKPFMFGGNRFYSANILRLATKLRRISLF